MLYDYYIKIVYCNKNILYKFPGNGKSCSRYTKHLKNELQHITRGKYHEQ